LESLSSMLVYRSGGSSNGSTRRRNVAYLHVVVRAGNSKTSSDESVRKYA
jgi:hypothetical protein